MKMKGKGGRGRRAKWRLALISVLTAAISGIICIVTCWITFGWTWDDVAYWLNPFSEGNDWTWLIYFAVVMFVLLTIWLIHMARMEKISNDE